MPYIYRVRRPAVERGEPQPEPGAITYAEANPTQPAADDSGDETSYRDLQARAKELGIAANQSREDLEAAIAKADG